MARYAEPMARLIDELKKLPGVGTKTAQRFAFHILRSGDDDASALAEAVRGLKASLRLCSVCNNITDIDPCAYCASPTRNQRLVCVVEEPTNIEAVERSRYSGVYHVLHGTLSPLARCWPRSIARPHAHAARRARRGGRSYSRHQPYARGRSHRELAGRCIARIQGPHYADCHGCSRGQRH